MSAISESATINVMLADYAAMDLTGVVRELHQIAEAIGCDVSEFFVRDKKS